MQSAIQHRKNKSRCVNVGAKTVSASHISGGQQLRGAFHVSAKRLRVAAGARLAAAQAEAAEAAELDLLAGAERVDDLV